MATALWFKKVECRPVEVDEIWGFVGKKVGHKTEEDGAELGDAYCFIGMERSTKLGSGPSSGLDYRGIDSLGTGDGFRMSLSSP